MTWYHLALFAHICGVLLLFIADGVDLTAMLGMRRAQAVEQVREWGRVEAAAEKLYPPAILLILATGIYMALTAWGIRIALSVQGPALNARRLRAIHAAAEAAPAGPVPPALARRIHDPVLWTSAQIMPAITLGIIFLMVIKPNLAGSLATIVVAAVLGVLSALPAWRTARAAAAVVADAAGGRGSR
jgi:hypothetical protein